MHGLSQALLFTATGDDHHSTQNFQSKFTDTWHNIKILDDMSDQ